MKQWKLERVLTEHSLLWCLPSPPNSPPLCIPSASVQRRLAVALTALQMEKIEHLEQSQHFQKSKLGQADQLLASCCQEWWVHVFLFRIVMPLFEFWVTCGRKRYAASMQCWCKLPIWLPACCSLMKISSSTEVYSTCAYSHSGTAFLTIRARSKAKQILSVIPTYNYSALHSIPSQKWGLLWSAGASKLPFTFH